MDQIIFSSASESGLEFNLKKVNIKNEKVFLHGFVNYKSYLELIENEYFQFEEELIIESGFRDFDKDKDIEISLRLEDELVELLSMNTEINNESIYKFLIDISKREKSNIFLMNESWYLLKVIQSISLPNELSDKGELKMGFITSWSLD